MAKAKKAAKKAEPKKAVKKAAAKKVLPKKAASTPPGGSGSISRGTAGGGTRGETVAVIMVTVHARFRNASAGASDFTATHNNQNPQRLTQSGDVHFNTVNRGDTVEINSDSPGDTTVTVSGANTNPVRMTAVPGQHLSDFFVVV